MVPSAHHAPSADDEMVEYFDVSKSDIFKVLRTAESTAHKLIKDNRPLDAGASERVVRVADITRLAEATSPSDRAGSVMDRSHSPGSSANFV